jgi:hypothetical protein
MLACFHVQWSKGKHNRSLKVAVQGLVLWPAPNTYIQRIMIESLVRNASKRIWKEAVVAYVW